MKIICLVKFTPDIENFIYDYEKNVLVRENTRMILNPDDACALAFALKVKEKQPETLVEIVTMGPMSVVPLVADLLRRNADKATVISDKAYVGSDTYITSKILGRYLKTQTYDCILTGTHAIDGDTSHVPSQLGEMLNVSQMSNIVKIDEQSLLATSEKSNVLVDIDGEYEVSTYEIELPAILSVIKESKYKLPYIKYKDIELDVNDRITIITNESLQLLPQDVGIEGSLTKVSRTYVKKMEKVDQLFLKNDEAGIEAVYTFLKTKGFI